MSISFETNFVKPVLKSNVANFHVGSKCQNNGPPGLVKRCLKLKTNFPIFSTKKKNICVFRTSYSITIPIDGLLESSSKVLPTDLVVQNAIRAQYPMLLYFVTIKYHYCNIVTRKPAPNRLAENQPLAGLLSLSYGNG